jgi:NitT/TauT family transport system ATP-binding protein
VDRGSGAYGADRPLVSCAAAVHILLSGPRIGCLLHLLPLHYCVWILGGQGDVFVLAHEFGKEFSDLINIVKAAEMLDFTDTPKQRTMLTLLGHRFSDMDTENQKVVWKHQILTLSIFKTIHAEVQASRNGSMLDDDVQDRLAQLLPNENPEFTFATFINWARFGNLVAFDEDSDEVSLQ